MWSPLRIFSLSNRHFSSKNFGQIKMRAKDDLIVLGIETSCDDTAAAVVSPFFVCFCHFGGVLSRGISNVF